MQATDRSRRIEIREVDAIVDEWGDESFPASDPPGALPPSVRAALASSKPSDAEVPSRPEPSRPSASPEERR